MCLCQIRHHIWFDNSNEVVTFAGDKLTVDIDASGLNEGIHSIRHYFQMPDGTVSPPRSALFLKTGFAGGDRPIRCLVRIDNSLNKESRSVMTDGIVHLNIDMSDIPDGLHQIAVQLLPENSNIVLSTNTSYFMKSASLADGTEIDCYAFIDNDISQKIRCSPANGVIHLDFDMQDLSNGIHKITIYLNPTESSTIMDPFTAFFIKTPVGGSKITQYFYWFDSYTEEMVTVDCGDGQPVINFLGLIDAKELPFRSSSFEFGKDGDNVILSSKHDFNFMALDDMGRMSSTQTKTYKDNRTQKIIPIGSIEHLTTCANKNTGTIEENGIKFYKFYAEIGDSLSISLSKPATFELFSPTDKTIIERKGRHSQYTSTAVLNETGTYYLAIHDLDGKNVNNETLTFAHVPRNAILNVSPSVLSAPKMLFSLDLYGNGFDNARKLVIENEHGTRFEVDSLYTYDNYHMVAAVEYGTEIPFGDYKISLFIDDEVSGEEITIQYPQSVGIVGRNGNAKIDVEVIPSKKASTPYMVDIRITNNSDVPCWGIPFNVACELNGESKSEDDEQNSYVFFMKDFFGSNISLDSFHWYETDNLLGSETPGMILPMAIAYLNPHETRVLKVGIISAAHEKVGLYAWAGEPYNEEIDGILIKQDTQNENERFPVSNIYTLETYAYLLSVMQEVSAKLESQKSGLIMRAPSCDDQMLQFIADYVPEVLSRIDGLDRPTSAAENTAALYQAVSRTFAGVVNCSSNMHSYNYFKNHCGIPGNSISEQIAYIYSHNMQSDPAIQIYLQQAARNMARTASPRKIMKDLAQEVANIPEPVCDAVCDSYDRLQAQSPNPKPKRRKIHSLQSGDPNDISGYADPNGGPFVGIDIKRLQYKIEFENDPAIANASASVVKVENKLDRNVFDLSSYTPLALHIGKRIIELPKEKSFVTTVDMRPSINSLLEIRHDFDEENCEARWQFDSLDPISLEPVYDSSQGFLPVNNSEGVGTGEIEYCIYVKAGLNHNTVIRNKANIIFDDNEAIETPEWVNVTDYIRPIAKIINREISLDGGTIAFDVEYSDDGSGVNSYDLSAKTKDSDKWIVVKPNISAERVEYTLSNPVDDLEFAVFATDNAGNRQTSADDDLTDVKKVTEPSTETDEQDELWYSINGQRINKSKSVNMPIISNKGNSIVILK